MDKWRLFEDSCIDYLNQTYGNEGLEFIGTGKSDSTSSDIKVMKHGQKIFNMESKMPESQSGQFVLIDNDGKFIFSGKNKSQENEFTDLIINYINSNYSIFKNVSTKSIPINLPTNIFEEWIKGHYINKDVEFVITSDSNDNFIIFPIDKYGDYFEIKANFRIKTSGSRELSKKYEHIVKRLFEENFAPCHIEWKGSKAYIVSDINIANKTKLYGSNYRYQFNIEDNKYLIKMLSNTNNANVIFSIVLINRQDDSDLDKFIKKME